MVGARARAFVRLVEPAGAGAADPGADPGAGAPPVRRATASRRRRSRTWPRRPRSRRRRCSARSARRSTCSRRRPRRRSSATPDRCRWPSATRCGTSTREATADEVLDRFAALVAAKAGEIYPIYSVIYAGRDGNPEIAAMADLLDDQRLTGATRAGPGRCWTRLGRGATPTLLAELRDGLWALMSLDVVRGVRDQARLVDRPLPGLAAERRWRSRCRPTTVSTTSTSSRS